MKSFLIMAVSSLVLGSAQSALAAFPSITTVVQPIEIDGPGVMTSLVTYVGYQFDWHDPGSEIMLTAQPNIISFDGQARDLNEAARNGIRFSREGLPPTSTPAAWPGVHGDTLQVTVDLSGFKQHPGSEDFDQLLVTTTLHCGLRNARVHWPTVHYVEYSVSGNNTFLPYSGVYSLEHVEAPEQPSQPEEAGPKWLRR